MNWSKFFTLGGQLQKKRHLYNKNQHAYIGTGLQQTDFLLEPVVLTNQLSLKNKENKVI